MQSRAGGASGRRPSPIGAVVVVVIVRTCLGDGGRACGKGLPLFPHVMVCHAARVHVMDMMTQCFARFATLGRTVPYFILLALPPATTRFPVFPTTRFSPI